MLIISQKGRLTMHLSLPPNGRSRLVAALLVTARKSDEKQRRPDVQFRRIVDRIEIDVGPASDGALTNITVDAKTFAELTTQRGPTEVQEKTSDTAREAGQTILQKCSQPVDSLSVPG